MRAVVVALANDILIIPCIQRGQTEVLVLINAAFPLNSHLGIYWRWFRDRFMRVFTPYQHISSPSVLIFFCNFAVMLNSHLSFFVLFFPFRSVMLVVLVAVANRLSLR